jgi:hypothetical protein
VEFFAQDGKVAVAGQVQEGDGFVAAGDPDGVAFAEFLDILSVRGEQQFFMRVPDRDLNGAAVGQDNRPVAERVRTEDADTEHIGTRLDDRPAGGEEMSGASGRRGDDHAVAGKGGDRLTVYGEFECDDMGGTAEADNGVVENPVGPDKFPAAQDGAVRHRADIAFTFTGGQRVERRFELVFADAGQEAEAAEIDSKDWNIRSVQEFRAEQDGAVAAEREQNIDGFIELVKTDDGRGGQMGGGLFVGEQLDAERFGLAGETLKDVGGVRPCRGCYDTSLFHGWMLP